MNKEWADFNKNWYCREITTKLLCIIQRIRFYPPYYRKNWKWTNKWGKRDPKKLSVLDQYVFFIGWKQNRKLYVKLHLLFYISFKILAYIFYCFPSHKKLGITCSSLICNIYVVSNFKLQKCYIVQCNSGVLTKNS